MPSVETAPRTMVFSLSAYQTWQRCEQRYEYAYVRRLRPLVRDLAPQRGIILHEYLSAYYTHVQQGNPAAEAHWRGIDRIQAYAQNTNAAVQVAFLAGDIEQAKAYEDLLPACQRIASAYFEVRGRSDAARYDVLMVEQPINLELVVGIQSRSVIDLVLRERERGIVWLVEHKSTTSPPGSSVRLRDFQTLLYKEVIERQRRDIEIDGVLWNYLRTKEPDRPHQNKNGQFSRAVGIDTTWSVFASTVAAAGQNPERYADVQQRLTGRETAVYFPRFEQVIVTDPKMLLDDYVSEAQRARQSVWSWEKGATRPVRSLTRDCDFCPYYRLCEAALIGGDEEDVIKMRFTTEREEKV